MSRILFAWELGDNLGHVSGFLPLARELRKRGHELILILKDLSHVMAQIHGESFPVLQAPIWQGQTPSAPPSNYAEILLHNGFMEADGLSGLVNGWRNLFTLTKPQLVIFDHAPTALLASRGLSLSRALIGTGFCSPPRVSPFPAMRSWGPHSPQQLADNEAHMLKIANVALARHDAAPLKNLTDLFDVDEDFLCTFPELDHYQQRGGNVRYWGARYSFGNGREPVWSPNGGKRVFAYLDKNFDDLGKVLQTLAGLPVQALVYVPGMPPPLITQYQSKNLVFVASPVDFGKLAGQCDAAICHAGHGTASALLLAGIPLLLLPNHLEQYLNALNIQNMGAGLTINPEAPNKDYATPMRRLLNEPEFGRSAQNFAAKYAGERQQERVIKIADRCDELLAHFKAHGDNRTSLALNAN
jgi:UDP:flavonoid glycosyltransferase YjiC (YdhE family)